MFKRIFLTKEMKKIYWINFWIYFVGIAALVLISFKENAVICGLMTMCILMLALIVRCNDESNNVG